MQPRYESDFGVELFCVVSKLFVRDKAMSRRREGGGNVVGIVVG